MNNSNNSNISEMGGIIDHLNSNSNSNIRLIGNSKGV